MTGSAVVAAAAASLALSSSQVIASGLRTSAWASTSSMRVTGMISRFFLMASEISTRSLAFSSGISTIFMPPREAASSFSFRPPIGSTRPRNVISPVMATSRRTGMPVITDTIAVTMATPKDGPSAGVAMVTAIVSVMTGIAVRRDVAMTGEITLRGRVLPIGGLKEKLLAASRGGMKTVLIPEENAKDLVEISEAIKKNLEIIPVTRMDEVLAHALVRKPEPITWDEETAKMAAAAVTAGEPVVEDDPGLTAH